MGIIVAMINRGYVMAHKIAFEVKVAQESGHWYVFKRSGRKGQWEKISDPKPNKKQAMQEMNNFVVRYPVA